ALDHLLVCVGANRILRKRGDPDFAGQARSGRCCGGCGRGCGGGELLRGDQPGPGGRGDEIAASDGVHGKQYSIAGNEFTAEWFSFSSAAWGRNRESLLWEGLCPRLENHISL